MQLPVSHRIRNQTLWLSPDRTLYWEDEQTLVVSDLHFGKTGHFRKSGIPVPGTVYREDLQRLVAQIQHYRPRRMIVVGDMFHSRENRELDLFLRWRGDLAELEIELVRGNHDVLREDWYKKAGIRLRQPFFSLGGFHFIHDIADPALPEEDGSDKPYFFSGHVHPGVRFDGAGKQSLCFPCFYFGRDFAVLPAFSRFTGTVALDPRPADQVFAIVNQSLVRC